MKRLCFCSSFVLEIMNLTHFAKAACTGKTWTANAGAETKDEGVQGDGFFPNEVWISANDCIEWTFVPKNEVHTVTFLKSGQLRPDAPFPVGPPGPPPPIPGQFGASGMHRLCRRYNGQLQRQCLRLERRVGGQHELYGDVPDAGQLQARLSGSHGYERNGSRPLFDRKSSLWSV